MKISEGTSAILICIMAYEKAIKTLLQTGLNFDIVLSVQRSTNRKNDMSYNMSRALVVSLAAL